MLYMGESPQHITVPSAGARVVEVVRASARDTLPLCDWCDLHLQGDFFFRRGHLRGIIERTNTAVWIVLVDSVMSGLVILYRESMLHNLYLAPDCRGGGIGTSLVQFFRPTAVRAKKNMIAGDPTGFYERLGFTVQGPDPELPHINVMTRPDGDAGKPFAQDRAGRFQRVEGGPGDGMNGEPKDQVAAGSRPRSPALPEAQTTAEAAAMSVESADANKWRKYQEGKRKAMAKRRARLREAQESAGYAARSSREEDSATAPGPDSGLWADPQPDSGG